MPLIVIGVLLLTFVLFKLIGGDISQQIAGKNADAETIAEIKHEYGLDKPLFWSWDSQFIDHFKNAVTFNFGRALDRERISAKILRGIGPSLMLTGPMFIGELIAAISLALIIAYVRGTVWDVTAVIICVVGMSIPYLSFIIFGQYFFAYKLNWFPIIYLPEEPMIKSVGLPILIGILAGLGGELRFYRTIMLDEMRNDYVRTAFAKGLTTTKVLFKHVLKNAMIPIITNIVLAIPVLILGSFLLERFFGIPGLGYLMIEAIGSRDYFVINAMTFIFSLLIVVFTLLADICYAFVDPRISLK
jgi:peptide/nickel transport system permease protein